MKRNIFLGVILGIIGLMITVAYATTFSVTYDKTTPQGTDAPSVLDDRDRETKQAVQERENVDHYWPYASFADVAGGNEVASKFTGEHRKVTFYGTISDPTQVSGKAHLYMKSDELYYQDDTNTTKQLTSGGQLNIVDADGAVVKTGNQTIAGIKTFSSIPVLTSSDPTADDEAARKLYVDNVVQMVNTITGAVAGADSTNITYDDTIPQITEGTEYMTLAITPKSATNKLKIDIVFNVSNSAANRITVALFQDTTANALAAVSHYMTTVGVCYPINFTHYMLAGTTSTTTFRIRAGNQGGSLTFNGENGSRFLGGIMASSITITEIRD